jgi:hypothetical protein
MLPHIWWRYECPVYPYINPKLKQYGLSLNNLTGKSNKNQERYLFSLYNKVIKE